MPNIHTENILVVEANIDSNNHVNNLVYLRWAHALSANHWNALATAAMQESTNWFLGAQSIEYYKEVKLAETITATTFIEKIERQKCFRKVIFVNEKNEEVAIANLVWICLQASSNRPLRVSEEVIGLFL
jgi:acyl-CoA thioester hydrolase